MNKWLAISFGVAAALLLSGGWWLFYFSGHGDLAAQVTSPTTREPTHTAEAIAPIAPIARITGFRDVPWGASEEFLRSKIGDISCKPPSNHFEYGDRVCRTDKIEFGEIKPEWPSWFHFRDGGLVAWRVMYSVRHRSIMLAATKEKYGEPSKGSSASFAMWKEPQAWASISLDHHEFDSIQAVTRAETSQHKIEQADRAAKAAKGL